MKPCTVAAISPPPASPCAAPPSRGPAASLRRFKEHQGANIGSVWDVRIDDLIPLRAYLRVHYGEA
jgi:hypothetical protein